MMSEDHVLKALEAGERSRTDFDTLPDETRQVIMDAVTRDSAAVLSVVLRTLIELGPDEEARNSEGREKWMTMSDRAWTPGAEMVLEHLATRLESIAQEK